jgi:hypothetical protein
MREATQMRNDNLVHRSTNVNGDTMSHRETP